MLERIKPLPDLVKNILDNLPQEIWESNTTTFFDPAIGGGQFVKEIERRLKKYGHSENNIRNRVFGHEYSHALIDLAVNMNQLVGQYTKKSYEDFFKSQIVREFDIVVGAPPFNSSKENSDQLWPLFAEKAINVTKKNGYVCYILPDTWTSGTRSVMLSGRKNLLTEVLNEVDVKVLNFDIKKYFPGIGSGFSALVVQKSKTKSKTKIITGTEEFLFDVKDLKFIPKTINKITLDIIKKITNHNKPCVYFKFYGKTPKLVLKDSKDKKHKFEFSNTSSNHQIKWGNVPGQGYGKKKVIYAYMGSRQKFEYDIHGTKSLMYNGRAFELEVNATEEGLKSYFESKLVKFINRDKWSQYNEPKILNLLPIIDFDKTWTDKKLYAYFQLTKEEICYIEEKSLLKNIDE